ncbi:MAG: LuxR C-terminal-related transcriptional regulator [Thermomicrobiales bacterium]
MPCIGRTEERATIRRLLMDEKVRLLTLTGTAGVGKTRLAIQATAEILHETDRFENAWFVPLASVSDPAMVMVTIATALGIRDGGNIPLNEAIIAAVQGTSTLVVLDTFEHVTAAASELAHLLDTCPDISLLITSRTPLHIYGEQLMAVGPLATSVPTPIDRLPAVLPDAIAVFVERVRATNPGFVLTPESYVLMADICTRLEGIPLAIELAASRTRVLSLSQLQTRLDRRLRILGDGPRDAPARQQSMASAVAWSYDLLSPQDQAALRHLAVFPAGFTIEAVERMAIDPAEQSAISALSSLADSSLLRQHVDEAGELRFVMFDAVREYGRELLERQDEVEDAQRAMAAMMLAVVLEMEPSLYRGRNLPYYLGRIDAEIDNLRASMSWAARHEPETLASLSTALGQYWLRRSMLQEGRIWAERVLELGPAVTPKSRLRAMIDRVRMMTYQSDDDLDSAYKEALAFARQLGDPHREIDLLVTHIVDGAIRREPQRSLQDFAAARKLMKSSGSGNQLSSGRPQVIRILGALVAMETGDLDLALSLVREAQIIARTEQDEAVTMIVSRVLGGISAAQGYHAEAFGHYREALQGYWSVGERWTTADVLVDIAWEFSQVRPDLTARLFGLSDQIMALIGLSPTANRNRPPVRIKDPVIAPIDDEAWEAAYQTGLTRSINAAIEEVLALQFPEAPAPATTRPMAAPTAATNLSRREREVLIQIAAGLTDREIAQKLGISYRTTTTYVASIFSKLAVTSRAAAAAFAVRHGLDLPT